MTILVFSCVCARMCNCTSAHVHACYVCPCVLEFMWCTSYCMFVCVLSPKVKIFKNPSKIYFQTVTNLKIISNTMFMPKRRFVTFQLSWELFKHSVSTLSIYLVNANSKFLYDILIIFL